jgi:hypothetical protein
MNEIAPLSTPNSIEFDDGSENSSKKMSQFTINAKLATTFDKKKDQVAIFTDQIHLIMFC